MQSKTKMSMMLKLGLIAIAAFVVLVPAFAKGPKSVTITVQNKSGQKVGTATLSQVPKGVKIELNLHDLIPGEHAIHIHQNAKCDVPDFKTAGGHFNPDNKQHGLQNPEGPHAGDIPNFIVTVNGKSKATVIATGITLSEGPHSVFSGGGTALVIHAKPDDEKTDPAGNAGDRVACGLIIK